MRAALKLTTLRTAQECNKGEIIEDPDKHLALRRSLRERALEKKVASIGFDWVVALTPTLIKMSGQKPCGLIDADVQKPKTQRMPYSTPENPTLSQILIRNFS
jgi:hypothetical protein